MFYCISARQAFFCLLLQRKLLREAKMARAACSNDFEENAITLSYDLQPKEEHSIVSAFSLITKEPITALAVLYFSLERPKVHEGKWKKEQFFESMNESKRDSTSSYLLQYENTFSCLLWLCRSIQQATLYRLLRFYIYFFIAKI